MMKRRVSLSPRAALFIGAAFLSTPAWAQDAPAPQQTVTPPPIMVTPAPAPAPAPVIRMAPAAPVVQAVPTVAEQQRSGQTAPRTAEPERRSAPAREARVAAPHSAASAPAPQAAAPAPAPAAQAPAPPQAAPAQRVPAITGAGAAVRTSDIAWPWILGGIILVLAGLAIFLLTRRRETDLAEEAPAAMVVDEPLVTEAEAVAEPMPAAPVIEPIVHAAPRHEPEVAAAGAVVGAAEEAEIHAPESEDLASVVEAPAPVARRPWLELAMRPVRAGTSREEAVVDIELTVGNAGDTPARDVRVSTFMLTDASETDMERMLVEHRADAAIEPMTIEPGEGTRIDAHLAAPKTDELGRSFNPVVFAEARYTLPDGREGRTAAAFRVGTAREEGIGPLAASRPHVTETVDAELFGAPEHA